MARLVLVEDQRKAQSEQKSSHRQAPTEGEAARMLLEANGYPAKSTKAQGQYQFRCPFHEEPGPLARQSTNFYLDSNTSQYYCQAASCAEKGNLVTLERFFGVENDPNLVSVYTSMEQRLKQFEAQLPKGERRQPFYDKGLNDACIERFRYGYDQDSGNYVLPYLEGRRPVAFRLYSPEENGPNGSKYWWEKGTDARLYNAGDGVGHQLTGEVFMCEGEAKAALLCQLGYAAVGLPGASMWKPEWSQAFNLAKQIYVCLDNDNPTFHRYDQHRKNCEENCSTVHVCKKCGPEGCKGHNPGQENAAKLIDLFGAHRAKNVVLPLVEDDNGDLRKKTDINEFFMRDGGTKDDFAALALGHGKTSPFVVRSLRDIRENPPDEAVFLVDQGLLPKGGRLLVTGAPKAGKSIFVENLALSIAAGIPFLRRFNIANTNPTPGHRVLLLDRELSERSLFDRLNSLIAERPGYAAAEDKLLIDHKLQFRLDEENAAMKLIGLIQANSAEVIILDTAYKFFSGDMESSKNVAKALSSLDAAIQETGVSVILTHHHRKKSSAMNGKEQAPDPDQVVGSFLWTGWPNGTVLLNFLNRRVESPFNTVASFAAFRDAAPPDPLALYRDKESIAYTSVVPYSFDDDDSSGSQWNATKTKLDYDSMANFVLENVPATEEDLLHMAAGVFGVKPDTARLVLLDVLDRHPDFFKDGRGNRNSPYMIKYKYDKEEEPYVAPEVDMGTQTEIGMP